MKKYLIAPSILAGDFSKIHSEIEMLNQSEADYIHVDVMDGVFVPNISFGFPVVEAINKYAQKPLDVHLMIQNPENYVERFKNAGAEIISVHYEACPHLHRNLQQLKSLDVKTGVAINPHTPVNLLQDVIRDIDLLVIMSVNPGFGGQKFIENTYEKVKFARNMIDQFGANTKIEVDGGVNLENASKLVEAGADVLVAGSFVFKSDNPGDTILKLKSVNQ